MKKVLGWMKANLPDEMDRIIRLKSIQWTWLYSVGFLIVWMLYESYIANQNNVRVNTIPGLLLVSQILILMVSQLIYRIRLTNGEDEEQRSTGKKAKIIVTLIILAVLVFAVVSTWAMLSVSL